MAMTIQKAIDAIIAAVPGAPFPNTVDTVTLGDSSQELTGVVSTFIATCQVIEQAVQLGANLIVTHESPFYSHRDASDVVGNSPVYAAKRRLIEESRVVIWRFHDCPHRLLPDSIFVGLLKDLSWEAYALPEHPYVCQIPPVTLLELGQFVKDRLGLSALRVVGDLGTSCAKIGLLPGFQALKVHMDVFGDLGVDAVITGEIHEWEISEYVRDAAHLGYRKGLIVTGHAGSEEPGMRWLVPWLQERLPGVAIHFIPVDSAFHQL